MPSSVIFLPIFPTGWTANKQKNPSKGQSLQVTVAPFMCHAVAFCPNCDSFSRLASLLQGASCQALTTWPGSFWQRTRDHSRHQKHGLFTWWCCTFTSRFYFPFWCSSRPLLAAEASSWVTDVSFSCPTECRGDFPLHHNRHLPAWELWISRSSLLFSASSSPFCPLKI